MDDDHLNMKSKTLKVYTNSENEKRLANLLVTHSICFIEKQLYDENYEYMQYLNQNNLL